MSFRQNKKNEIELFTPTFSASSGTDTAISLTPTVTQSGTAGWTGINVLATETSAGTGVAKGVASSIGGAVAASYAVTGTLSSSSASGTTDSGSAGVYGTVTSATAAGGIAVLGVHFGTAGAAGFFRSTGNGAICLRMQQDSNASGLRIIAPGCTTGNTILTTSNSLTTGNNLQIAGTSTIASGTRTDVLLTPTITQSGTAGFIVLDCNPAITTQGSGSQLLQRWAVGSVMRASLDYTGKASFSTTTAGGSGNVTQNSPTGTVIAAGAATSLTVTNSTVLSTSMVFATIQTNDVTAVIKNVVVSAGSFTINLTAPTANTTIVYLVIN